MSKTEGQKEFERIALELATGRPPDYEEIIQLRIKHTDDASVKAYRQLFKVAPHIAISENLELYKTEGDPLLLWDIVRQCNELDVPLPREVNSYLVDVAENLRNAAEGSKGKDHGKLLKEALGFKEGKGITKDVISADKRTAFTAIEYVKLIKDQKSEREDAPTRAANLLNDTSGVDYEEESSYKVGTIRKHHDDIAFIRKGQENRLFEDN
jgi:hypothetical protein